MKKTLSMLCAVLMLLMIMLPMADAANGQGAEQDPVTVSLTGENFPIFYEKVLTNWRTEKNGNGIDIYPELRLSYRLKSEFAGLAVPENSSVTIQVSGTYVLTVIDRIDWSTGEITLTDLSSSETITNLRNILIANGNTEGAAKYGTILSETGEGVLEIPIQLNRVADGAWLFGNGIRGPVAPLMPSDYVDGKTLIAELQNLRVVSVSGELQLRELPEGLDPNLIGEIRLRNITKDEPAAVKDMEYILYDDGTAAITRYTGNEKRLTVPDRIGKHEVRAIGSYAFSYCTGLESVTLPDSVAILGSNAFDGCSGLTEIRLPSKMESIGSGAFSGCSSLREIAIPAGVTEIGWSTFSECSSLQNITIPAGVRTIERSAFSSCESLERVEFPDGLTEIGDYAFYRCSALTGVVLPAKTERIGSNAFSYCTGLESVTLPDSVVSLGNYAFADCVGLTEVRLPAELESIGSAAFSGCSSLRNITIPAGVRIIEQHTFSSCESLEWVEFPVGLTKIGDDAFYSCSALTELELPAKMESLGSGAFRGCTGLQSVTLPDGLTEIGEETFYDCSALKEIIIPAGVHTIRQRTFSSCESLERVEFPVGLAEIGDYAFYHCSALTEVVLPEGVTRIGDSAFLLCGGLERVTFPDGLVSIGSSAFDCCWDLGVLELPDSILEMGIDALPSGLGTRAVVSRGSFAEEYCRNNDIDFSYYDEAPPWKLLPENERPGRADLEAVGSGIEYPREDEYYERYAYATVRAPKGHSVLGFGSADHQGRSFTVLNGEEVRMLAERKNYVCCIVLSQGVARWINREYLVVQEPVMDNGTVRMSRDEQTLTITLYGIRVSDRYAVEGISEKKDYMEPEYQWQISFADSEHRYMVDTTWFKEYPPVSRTIAFEDMATRFYVEKEESRYYSVSEPSVSHTDTSITWKISLEESGVDCESITDVSAFSYAPDGGHFYG